MMKLFQYKKEGKPIPNTQEELVEMIQKDGLSKKEKEILRGMMS